MFSIEFAQPHFGEIGLLLSHTSLLNAEFLVGISGFDPGD